MIDFIVNEQEIAKSSVFLKIKDGCRLKILSNLISFSTFYDKKTNQRILWAQGINERRRQELYYWVEIDGKEGVLRIPMSVFVAMNDTERLIKKDKKNFIWIIGKKGEGLQTKYNVIKGEEIKPPTKEELKSNNEKLKKIIELYYQKLKQRLDEYLSEQRIGNEEKVNPNDIPF
ncbi:MAG: hypothetical protein N2505_06625 [Endomicrobia bacterium]|nr:hypothetical protein [Endomicrobiia bacterium]